MFISFWEPLGFPNREELWKAARAARTTLHMGSILFLSLFRAQDGRLKRMFTTGKGRRMDMNVMDCKRKRAQDWHVARLYSISVSPCFLFPFLDKDELHEVGSFVTCHYIDWDFFWLSSLGGCLVQDTLRALFPACPVFFGFATAVGVVYELLPASSVFLGHSPTLTTTRACRDICEEVG